MTDQQQAREAFEAWITSRSWYERLHCNLKQTSDGNYCHYKVNDRWVAWQAAIAHASSASAEECSVDATNPEEIGRKLVDDHVAGGGKLVDARDAARWRKFASMVDPATIGRFTVYKNSYPKDDEIIADGRHLAEAIDQAIAGRREQP